VRKACSVYFFFSSRRRHTRCLSDWSSDVCSSDLGAVVAASFVAGAGGASVMSANQLLVLLVAATAPTAALTFPAYAVVGCLGAEIGRASCRERVEARGGAGRRCVGQCRRDMWYRC